MKKLKITACVVFALSVSVFSLHQKSQAQIVLDFTGDTFFSANPVAQAALEAAAAEINANVHFDCLDEITNDTITGTDGGVTVNFDFSTQYTNPADGLPVTIQNTAVPAGQINVFAGARTFGGNTLGQGGPAGTGLSFSGSVAPGATGTAAQAIANAVANEEHSRDAGPVIVTQSGSVAGGVFDFEQGIRTGAIAFDDDANWHFDHTVPVTAGASDFFSVALHELLHVLGVGTSDTWTSLISGTDYLGAEGIAANGGSGTGLLFSDGEHLAIGTPSPRIADGLSQVAVLDPALVTGTRRNLTELDLALLRDLGFKTVTPSAIPEPTSVALLALCGAAFCSRRRRLAL